MGILKKLFNKNEYRTQLKLVQDQGNGWYSYGNDIFKSDVIRTCVRVQSRAIGKLVPQHIREDSNGFKINPEPYIKMLLSQPNPLMNSVSFWEKVSTQLALNNNAFILLEKDRNTGLPFQMYPISAIGVEAIYNKSGELFLKFTQKNGKTDTYPYSSIIHLRQDCSNNDLFGENPMDVLLPLLEIMDLSHQSVIRAIKNSSVLKWLLKFKTNMRPEDIVSKTQEFTNNFLGEGKNISVGGIDVSTDAQQIFSNDYVPNIDVSDRATQRIYSFFNINEDIIQSKYDENQWLAYQESVIEPISLQMSAEFTRRLFTRKEIAFGNRIVFNCNHLQTASLQTKLSLVQYVDRGLLNRNEVRAILNLPPTEGGDEYLLRLDTATLSERGNNTKGGEGVNEENTNSGNNSQ